jgi:hypothetical protein
MMFILNGVVSKFSSSFNYDIVIAQAEYFSVVCIFIRTIIYHSSWDVDCNLFFYFSRSGSDSVNDEEYSCDVISSLLAGKLFFTLKYLLSLEGVYLIDAISFDTII